MVLSKFIGDRAFYRRILKIAVPIMIQMGITNLVNPVDNIMVGTLGTESMSGVSIVNQFMFVFNLLIFGSVSAAGIFSAQFFGRGDTDGVRYTFRFKFLVNTIATLIAITVFAALSTPLISIFLHSSDSVGDLALTLSEGRGYLFIMLIGLLPYAIAQAYGSSMRETKEVVPPMVASVIAVFTNLILNYVLIFGKFGFAPLGVRGAAIATVISRFFELLFLLIWAYTHKGRCPYLVGALRSMRIPSGLFKSILYRGLPLMINEFMWSLAITFRNQCYSTRGLDVVAGQNISITIWNLFSVFFLSVGTSIAIIVGAELGMGEIEKAKDTARKMLCFSVSFGAVIGGIMIALSGVFPLLYNTSDAARDIASHMIIFSALAMPFSACAHSSYYTIRSGGKILGTILLDSVYMWVVSFSLAFILTRFTSLDIYYIFALCQLTELTKAALGLTLVKKIKWAQRLDKSE